MILKVYKYFYINSNVTFSLMSNNTLQTFVGALLKERRLPNHLPLITQIFTTQITYKDHTSKTHSLILCRKDLAITWKCDEWFVVERVVVWWDLVW